MRIGITDSDPDPNLSAADRAKMLADADGAPWFVQPIIRAFADPAAFRARILVVMPRVFFALVPVFAAIVALFYRRRHLPAFLVFAMHLHAFAFVVFSLSEAAKFTGWPRLAEVLGAILVVAFAVYALKAFRAVFGGSWPVTVAKAAGIGFVYLLVSVPAFIIMLVWATWT
jgi:hypothetical protein